MNIAVEKLFLDDASNRHLDYLESEAIHIMREVERSLGRLSAER